MFLWQRVAIQWKCFFTEFLFLKNPFPPHCNKGRTSWEFETSEFDGGMSSEGGVWGLSAPCGLPCWSTSGVGFGEASFWDLALGFTMLWVVLETRWDGAGVDANSINMQGLDTSSYNLFILSRTRSSLVIRLKTLYAYACSFHDNINSLHSNI